MFFFQILQKYRKSPKKRKHLKRAAGGTVGLFPKNLPDTFFRDPSLLESEKFDWFGHLVSTLETSFPDLLFDDKSLKIDNISTGKAKSKQELF